MIFRAVPCRIPGIVSRRLVPKFLRGTSCGGWENGRHSARPDNTMVRRFVVTVVFFCSDFFVTAAVAFVHGRMIVGVLAVLGIGGKEIVQVRRQCLVASIGLSSAKNTR